MIHHLVQANISGRKPIDMARDIHEWGEFLLHNSDPAKLLQKSTEMKLVGGLPFTYVTKPGSTLGPGLMQYDLHAIADQFMAIDYLLISLREFLPEGTIDKKTLGNSFLAKMPHPIQGFMPVWAATDLIKDVSSIYDTFVNFYRRNSPIDLDAVYAKIRDMPSNRDALRAMNKYSKLLNEMEIYSRMDYSSLIDQVENNLYPQDLYLYDPYCSSVRWNNLGPNHPPQAEPEIGQKYRIPEGSITITCF